MGCELELEGALEAAQRGMQLAAAAVEAAEVVERGGAEAAAVRAVEDAGGLRGGAVGAGEEVVCQLEVACLRAGYVSKIVTFH